MKFKKIVLNHWPIFLILAAGAFFRFFRLHDLTTFLGDQGYDFLKVKEIIEGNLTLLGPKIGPYNQFGNLYLGPAYYYLLAPFLYIFKLDPIGPALLTVLLSIGTIFLIYLIGVNFFSKKVAVLSALLFAINPFLINQSRAASNPHLIPFFSSLVIFSTMSMYSRKRKEIIWPIIVGFSLGIIFQLHYLAICLFLAVFAILFFSKSYHNLVQIAFSFLVAISPQILFELKHNFFVTNLFIKQFENGQTTSTLEIFMDNFSKSVDKISIITFPYLSTQFLIVTLLLILLAITKDKRLGLFLIIPVFFNLFLTSLYPNGPLEHYFSSVYPHLILAFGVAFFTVFNRLKNITAKALMSLFLIVVIGSSLSKINLANQNGYTMPEGWNLSGVKKASQIIAKDIPSSQKFNVAATLDGDTRAMPYRYLLSVYEKTPLDVESYPEAQTLYLVSKNHEEGIYNNMVWEIASMRPFMITNKWYIQNGIYLYKLKKIN